MDELKLWLVRFDGIDYAVIAPTMTEAMSAWLQWNRSCPEDERADEPIEFDQVVKLDVEKIITWE